MLPFGFYTYAITWTRITLVHHISPVEQRENNLWNCSRFVHAILRLCADPTLCRPLAGVILLTFCKQFGQKMSKDWRGWSINAPTFFQVSTAHNTNHRN